VPAAASFRALSVVGIVVVPVPVMMVSPPAVMVVARIVVSVR